jgi:hypothetical protein
LSPRSLAAVGVFYLRRAGCASARRIRGDFIAGGSPGGWDLWIYDLRVMNYDLPGRAGVDHGGTEYTERPAAGTAVKMLLNHELHE